MKKHGGAGMLGGWQCGFVTWVCFIFGNSRAIYLECVHFFIYVCHTSGEKFKTATNNKTYEGSRNGNSLDNLKREPSALFASFFSKAIHSARCHHREQQKYQYKRDSSLSRGRTRGQGRSVY